MSGPFRELCVELSDEAMAIAKGIVEAAVAQAHKEQPAPYHRPSQTSSLLAHIDRGNVGRYLCEHFGWKAVTAWRNAEDQLLTIAAKLRCGHVHHFSLDELTIERGPEVLVLELLMEQYEKSSERHPCYCVPRRQDVRE